ncbi:MAG: homocysteine S-methyltransferase family protein [Melioribacteraceae bacterium]|nr:homocysteine S-methyltransferase family protein [Melioribacteraceae bacterium]
MDYNNIFLNYQKPLLVDGAIGSLIQQRGGFIDDILWSSKANLIQPELVKTIYMEYISAGCDIKTTNTFRTNHVALLQSGEDINIEEFVKVSVNICKESIVDKRILIAGSNAPSEDCYQKERIVAYPLLEYNHKKHIELLWENGCDFILNETQSHFDEIKIISKFCSRNKIPFVISLFFDDNLRLLSGELVREVIDFISEYNPLCLSVNCISDKLFKKLNGQTDKRLSFYLNCGSGNYSDTAIKCGIDAENYLEQIKSYITKDINFVGACCGSNTSHIKTLRSYIDSLY